MHNNKKKLCAILFCTLLLAGCTQEKPVSDYQLPEKSEKTYTTAEVYVGTFKQIKTVTVPASYLKHQSITCDYEGAVLKEKLLFPLGSRVNAGDVIATVSFEVSEVELARLELAYERAVYSKESGVSSYYQSIASIKGNDRVSYLQRLQMEYQLASYIQSADRQCQQALEQLEQYRIRTKDVQIVAPCDGIVTYANPILDPGDEIPMGTELITLADPEFIYLELDPSMSVNETAVAYPMFSYGNTAHITLGTDTFEGIVSSAPVMGSLYKKGDAAQTENSIAFVTSDGLDAMTQTGHYVVQYVELALENMVMVPAKAVNDYQPHYEPAPKIDGVSVEKDPYVYILANGHLIKRYVTCGPGNSKEICILDGLSPGQVVVLD